MDNIKPNNHNSGLSSGTYDMSNNANNFHNHNHIPHHQLQLHHSIAPDQQHYQQMPQQHQFQQPQAPPLAFPLLPTHNNTNNNNGGHSNGSSNQGTPPLPILKSSLPDPLLSSSNAQSVSMNRRRSSNATNSPSSGDYDSKTCQFCNKQFAHKGSLGRHLDFKKGDPWHPIEQVNLIRINASRRRSSDFSFHSIDESNNNGNNNSGSNNNNNLSSTSSTPVLSNASLSKVPSSASLNKIPSNTSLHTIGSSSTPMGTSTSAKKRRVSKKSMAISQMSSDSASGQKEKSKLRRKLRDRRIKAKILTNEWFHDLFANQKLPDFLTNTNEHHPPELFVQLVALYLPVNEWPLNAPPDESYLNLIINRMKVRQKSNLISLLNLSFNNYKGLRNDVKFKLWNQESIKILKATIGNFSICDLYEIKSVIAKREQANFEEICRNDKLSAFVEVESTPNVEGEEELEEEEEEVEETDHSPDHQHPQQQQHHHHHQQQQQMPNQQQAVPPQQIPPHHNPYIPQIPEVQHPNFDDFSSSFDKFY
ncbi:hypothetical protein Cantr_04983 [Candida viswanathii]|uniref:C2H2-type domain-containing protein n=1 Tax=Candida viswanathii TaxID=5486 RepID=A0A367XTC6_9ASCO|nr:hypothetical protein Cantr_04983 [Candida viswanathii]